MEVTVLRNFQLLSGAEFWPWRLLPTRGRRHLRRLVHDCGPRLRGRRRRRQRRGRRRRQSAATPTTRGPRFLFCLDDLHLNSTKTPFRSWFYKLHLEFRAAGIRKPFSESLPQHWMSLKLFGAWNHFLYIEWAERPHQTSMKQEMECFKTLFTKTTKQRVGGSNPSVVEFLLFKFPYFCRILINVRQRFNELHLKKTQFVQHVKNWRSAPGFSFLWTFSLCSEPLRNYEQIPVFHGIFFAGNDRTFSLPGTTLADPDTEELVNPFGKKRRKKKKKMETNLLKEILDFKPAKRFSHWNKLDDALTCGLCYKSHYGRIFVIQATDLFWWWHLEPRDSKSEPKLKQRLPT